jgi:nitrate/nitrite transport system permease protein
MSKLTLERWAAAFALPLIGAGTVLLLWSVASATFAQSLPSPAETWQQSRLYVLEPFEKRGELDQGILRFTWYSLERVAQGYTIAILIGAPLGFLLGMSKLFQGSFDPIIQILRPVSPLAWLPLGLVIFQKPEPAGIFTIAMCSMWPTVLNTALGVRAVPQAYLNVARVLKLSRTKRLFKIMLPAALPYMFTGFRLSLGIAWLVIVAAEMLTGAPGVGGFLVAGVQCPHLRAHHPVHPHHRLRRLRSRPPDGRRREAPAHRLKGFPDGLPIPPRRQ